MHEELITRLKTAKERLGVWCSLVEQERCCSLKEREAINAECDESGKAIDDTIEVLQTTNQGLQRP